MSAEEQAQFLQGLAEDLNARSIALPSFPDVVISIRTALEDPTCTAERLARTARTDPVLVSRLLMSANSAFHNRAGIEIVDLDLAISRLGFEAVRNAAITLAVEQIFNASQHPDLRDRLKDLWSRSIDLACLCAVIARSAAGINADNAYLCGLLHEVGKLYILTKARDYPRFLGDAVSVDAVLTDWHASVGRSIIEAWGFPDDVVATVDLEDSVASDARGAATLPDVVHAAVGLLKWRLEASNAEASINDAEDTLASSLGRLSITEDNVADYLGAADSQAASLRQSVG